MALLLHRPDGVVKTRCPKCGGLCAVADFQFDIETRLDTCAGCAVPFVHPGKCEKERRVMFGLIADAQRMVRSGRAC